MELDKNDLIINAFNQVDQAMLFSDKIISVYLKSRNESVPQVDSDKLEKVFLETLEEFKRYAVIASPLMKD